MARSALRSDQMGLREAAEYFGVSVDTLRRRIKDELLPEAELVAGQFGNTWVLPSEALEVIGEREGWTPVRADGQTDHTVAALPGSDSHFSTPPPPSPPESWTGSEASSADAPAPPGDATVVDLRTGAVRMPMGNTGEGLTAEVLAELVSVREAITAAEVRAATAEAKVEHLETDIENRVSTLRRAEADLEYWKAQHDRLETEASTEREKRTAAEQSASVAEARIQELRSQHEEIVEAQRNLTKERDAQIQALRAAEGALHDAESTVRNAHGSMGWWSRRRFAKIQSTAEQG